MSHGWFFKQEKRLFVYHPALITKYYDIQLFASYQGQNFAGLPFLNCDGEEVSLWL